MKWTILFGSLFLLSACDGGPDIHGFKLIQPDHEYEVDTWGFNSEVYEITPRNNHNYTCLMWMLDSGSSMSIDCFPKDMGLDK